MQPREAIETSPRCKLVVRATRTRFGKVPGSSLVVSKEELTMVFFVIFFCQKGARKGKLLVKRNGKKADIVRFGQKTIGEKQLQRIIVLCLASPLKRKEKPKDDKRNKRARPRPQRLPEGNFEGRVRPLHHSQYKRQKKNKIQDRKRHKGDTSSCIKLCASLNTKDKIQSTPPAV